MAEKSLQEHFREQAELIDRLFTYRFAELDKRWDAKLNAWIAKLETTLDAKLDARDAKLETSLDAKFESKIDAKFDEKLEPIRNELAAIKKAVHIVITRLT